MDDLEPVPSPVQEIGGKYMYKYIYSVKGSFLLEMAMGLKKCAKSHNETILNLNTVFPRIVSAETILF